MAPMGMGGATGAVRPNFQGTGGELFVTFLVGYLLTAITIGIYAPWFVAKLIKFFTNNTTAIAQDGTRFRLRFAGRPAQAGS